MVHFGFLIYRSQSLFYLPANKQVGFETKNIVPFIAPHPPPKMKNLAINLTKQVQYLYEEHYKILMNEIKEELNNGEIFFIHQ